MLVGHGSRLPGFDASMKRSASALRRLGVCGKVTCAYLEIARPSLGEAIDRAASGGARRIVVLPFFLQAGMHVRRDIPSIVAAARRRHAPGVDIRLAPYLGHDPRLTSLLRSRARQAR